MDEPSSSSRNNSRVNQPDEALRGPVTRGRARASGPPMKQSLIPPPPTEDANFPRKRPRNAPHPNAQHAKMPRKETDVVDRIWHDIDEEQREKQAKKKAAAEEAKRTEPPVTSAGQWVELTVANLKSFKNEETSVNDFIGREDMVDRLLGYKMLLGKMENCGTLGYEKMSDQEVKQLSADWFKKFNPNVEAVEQLPEHSRGVGPHTPTSPPPEEDNHMEVKPRRGPKTPPGSPGPSNPPNQGAANRREMVEQLARTFGQSTHEVEEALGDQLDKALEDCSKKLKNEMMETFKAALKKMIDKKPKISSDLSDQMELVSDTSLSVDMKIVKKEEPDSTMPQYHLIVPPPPLPPQLPPNYSYYAPAAPVYRYTRPSQPVYQQSMMCYATLPTPHYVPSGAPPQIHYQLPPNQSYQHQQVTTMVLPPVNVPPPPMGVRIDTPMPQQIPPVVQALPPSAMPPPQPPTLQAPPPQPTPSQFTGDCWRPNPPQPQPVSDSWQPQHQSSVAPVAVAPPVSAAPLVAGVQTTLFSALGLHKPPPPPPPPLSGISAPVPPFASLSGPPPPPPPLVGSAGPSTPCPLNFPPPPPPPSQSANGVVLSSPTSTGYRHHGSAGRVPPFSNPFNKF